MRRLITILAVAMAVSAARAVDVRIESDRLTLDARNEPLRTVLERFAYAGVSVRFDPALDGRITASVTNEPMDKALSRILADYGYIITWDTIPGPVGDLPRLAEMQVFRPGRKQEARPLGNGDGKLRIVKDASGHEYVADEVLIGMKRGTTAEQFRELLALYGGTVVGCVPGVGVYQVRFPPGANIPAIVDAIKANNMVASVEPNYASHLPAPVAANDATVAAAKMKNPGTAAAGAPSVAILDSGLLHIDGLDQNVKATYDATKPGNPISDPAGHGTQMALLAAGLIDPTGTQTADGGAVPVVAIRNFDEAGYTSNYALMQAMDFALSQGARVINMSWGTDTSSEFIKTATDYAQSKGAVLVAAAGNNGASHLMYPAAYPGVVAVTAYTPDGTLWSDSNRGDGAFVSAPAYANFPVGNNGPAGSYAGTSISSAYVSRELALYFARHPTATSADAIKALQNAVSVSGTSRNASFGYGRLDAAAVQRLRAQ